MIKHAFYGPHLHDEYVIDITLGGEGTLFASKNEYVLPAKSVFIMSPFLVHSAKIEKHAEWLLASIYVPRSVMHSLLRPLKPLCEFVQPAALLLNEKSIIDAAHRLIETLEFNNNVKAREEALNHFIFSLDLLKRTNFFDLGVEFQKASTALLFINRNFKMNIKIDEIASFTDLSPNYFISVFKKFAGVSPHQYLMARRLAEAHKLLRTNIDMPLSDVAHECGFYDQSHFIGQFKRVYAIAPLEYRASQLQDSRALNSR